VDVVTGPVVVVSVVDVEPPAPGPLVVSPVVEPLVLPVVSFLRWISSATSDQSG
jgi:hypothetical protein